MAVHPLPPSALKGEGMTSQRARDRLIAKLKEDGIQDKRVLDVMRNLPRHHFIDQALHSRAYENTALPIGHGQTISQPWVVARMTEALLEPFDAKSGRPQKVLEIGTGSGYQAVVLASLVPQLYTVERIEELLRQARRRFRQLGIENIRSRHDDGKLGLVGRSTVRRHHSDGSGRCDSHAGARSTKPRRRARRTGRLTQQSNLDPHAR
jgi:protein-L-isoaspartate(D-aspartate) O-methyltransferase